MKRERKRERDVSGCLRGNVHTMPTDIHRTNETKTTRPDTWTHLRPHVNMISPPHSENITPTLTPTPPPPTSPSRSSNEQVTHCDYTSRKPTPSKQNPPQLNRRERTPWNGLPHLTLTTILYWQYTLYWQHTQLTTHSTGNTLYRQNALPTTRSPTDSTLSRTRQQHLHPSQSPLCYVHSYSRTTRFLSLYYTYFAP